VVARFCRSRRDLSAVAATWLLPPKQRNRRQEPGGGRCREAAGAVRKTRGAVGDARIVVSPGVDEAELRLFKKPTARPICLPDPRVLRAPQSVFRSCGGFPAYLVCSQCSATGSLRLLPIKGAFGTRHSGPACRERQRRLPAEAGTHTRGAAQLDAVHKTQIWGGAGGFYPRHPWARDSPASMKRWKR
jgi:hypothetical protein